MKTHQLRENQENSKEWLHPIMAVELTSLLPNKSYFIWALERIFWITRFQFVRHLSHSFAFSNTDAWHLSRWYKYRSIIWKFILKISVALCWVNYTMKKSIIRQKKLNCCNKFRRKTALNWNETEKNTNFSLIMKASAAKKVKKL